MATEEERIEIDVVMDDHTSRPAKQITKNLENIGKGADDTDKATTRLQKTLDRANGSSSRLNKILNKMSFDRARRGSNGLTKALSNADKKTNILSRGLAGVGRVAAAVLFGRGSASGVGNLSSMMRSSQRNGGGIWGMISRMNQMSGLLSGGGFIGMAGQVAGIALLASLLPSAVTGVSALGAGILSLLGPAAQLAGLAGVLIPLFATMGGIAITGMMGASGIGDALGDDPEKAAEAMEKMGKNAQSFVKAVKSVRGDWKDITGNVQEVLLDGLEPSIKRLSKNYLPILDKGFTLMGRSMNRTVKDWERGLANKGTQNRISSFFRSNAKTAELLGRNLSGVGGGLLKIGVAAAPTLNRILDRTADGLDSWSRRLDVGEMRGFFGDAEQTLYQVGGWINNIFKGLGRIVTASKPMTDFLMGGLSNLFRDFGNADVGDMRAWFTKQIPNLRAIGNFVKIAWNELGRMSTSENLAPLLGTISDHLPKLTDLFLELDQQVVPEITRLLDSLGDNVDTAAMKSDVKSFGDMIHSATDIINMLNDFWNTVNPANANAVGDKLFGRDQDKAKPAAPGTVPPPAKFGQQNQGLMKPPAFGPMKPLVVPPPNTSALNTFGPTVQSKVNAPLDTAKSKFNLFGNTASAQNGKVGSLAQRMGIFSSQAQNASGKADNLTGAIKRIPNNKKITVTADTSQAQGAINRVVNDNNGRRIVLTVDTRTGSTTALRPVGGGFNTAMAEGGPTYPGLRALVGEVGKEGWINAQGKLSIIGQNGPEVRKFDQQGYVVPNNQLAQVKEAIQKARGGAGNAQVGPDPTRGRSGAPAAAQALPPVNVNINGDVSKEVNIERAVHAGIKKAMREKSERS